MHIRFYAGHPLRTPSGHVIGTLCLIDRKPRSTFTADDRANLKSLADLVLDKLEMRRLELAKAEGQVRFERISATSPDGIICADHQGHITFWNAAAERLFGYLFGRPMSAEDFETAYLLNSPADPRYRAA